MSVSRRVGAAARGRDSPRGEIVGRVASLHRYPVKSMGGECLERVRITPRGVEGDRAAALVDGTTGRVVSAKRPRTWGAVYSLKARLGQESGEPSIEVRFEDGTTLSSRPRMARERLEARLSDLFGRPVAFATEPPEAATCEYHWPDMAGLVQEGRTYRDEITEWQLPRGTFFDSSSLHLLSTASLERLSELAPASDFHATRFRPNVVLATSAGARGFLDNEWIGRELQIGDAGPSGDGVRLRVTKACMRCVMVTLPVEGLPKDPGVLRAAFDHNEGNVGVKCEVAAPGTATVGDTVRLG